MSGTTKTVERERKFEIADDVTLPEVPGASVVDASDVRLVATYWDTAHRRLLRWGHTLRHRRASDGSEDGWTLKLAIPTRRKETLRRAEITAPGSPWYPPAAIRQVARAFVRRTVLTPIALIKTDRHRVEFAGAGGTDRIELSDDRVSSIAGLRRRRAFRQVEVEAVSPEAGALVEGAAEALVRAGAVETEATKLAMVLGDTPEPEIALPRTDPGISIRDVVRFAIGSGAERLVANDPAARIGSDPEAIHQARVATRRLRSDLKTLEPLLDATAAERIREELRWIGALLGAVRDADVLIARVEDLGRRLPLAPDATAEIVVQLDEDHHGHHVELVGALESRRYVALVEALIDAVVVPPLVEAVDGDRRARPRVHTLVWKSWHRVSRAVDRLGPDPDDAALHEIRKRAKRARYAAELVAAAEDEKAAFRLARRLADLQDILGELQDAVVAEERIADLVRDDRLTAPAAFAAGKLTSVIAQDRATARDKWLAAWKEARSKKLRHWLR